MKSKPWFLWVFLALAFLIAGTAVAQSGDDEAAARARMAELKKLSWVEGPANVPVDGNSQLVVPEGYVFLGKADTSRFLELNENLSDDSEVMIAPKSLAWQAYLEFVDEGYVKDEEKIDAPALLKTLQEGTEASNVERRNRGWADLHVVGWASAPSYNRGTNRLEWATLLESEGERSANFSTKVLGRRGHTSVIMVADPQALSTSQRELNGVLAGYSFNAGDTYAEWKPGDKVAEYGLAALIVGGAAAVATKKGFWASLVAFAVTAKKLVIGAVIGLGAWVRSLFKRKD